MTVELISTKNPSKEQLEEISVLQNICFDVSDQEVEEDFYHTPSIQILAYFKDKLVGWAAVHITDQMYKEKNIKIGGYGICTHPDFRQMGIATKVAAKAMDYLREHGCDIGFLSVDPEDKKSIKLHQKYGFKMMSQYFSWTNSKGKIDKDLGGMVAPINSKELFEFVLNDNDSLYVGNGYW